ncbi:MAG: flagellar biosynthesis protein FlhA [Bacillota bacterium]
MAVTDQNRLNLNNLGRLFRGNTDILAAVAFIAMVVIIIIPVTKWVLDILLTLNIAFALVVLLVTLFASDTRELNIFPSVLLTATLFRLALNISSTRLILSEANAGSVIQAFGQFVVAGNYVVGMVVFVIITVVQFVVITNGAGRVAEVAARFTLDALPGKQMSIDADFNAGLIDEETARNKRKELQKEADFYGSMDGASKFVRGDAIAGIVIVLINIVGGLGIGVLQLGMNVEEAASVFTILTVGDGLVAQVPALLISTSAGMLVTRSTAEASFGEEMTAQLVAFPKVIMLAAVLLFFLGVVPGMPPLPFFLLAAAGGVLSFVLFRERRQVVEEAKAEAEQEAEKLPPEPDDFSSILKVELMEVEIGYNLVELTDESKGGNLLERITAARKKAVNELGIIIQPIRVRDNLQLGPFDYRFKLKGNEIARGQVRPGLYMALNPEGELPPGLDGIDTKEPTFNLPAVWISGEARFKAEALGCTVVDASTVLITHLTEVIKSNAHELLGRQAVKEMIESLREINPAVVEELTPEVLSLGEVQKVMQNLLREKVPLHDLVTMMEELSDQARVTKDIDSLTESVRQALRRTITNQYINDQGKLDVVTIDPKLEKMISESIQTTRQGSFPVMEPQMTQNLIDGIGRVIDSLAQKGISPVILTSPAIRLPLKRLLDRFHLPVSVLSINEILPEVKVEAVGVIKENEN